MNDLPDEIRDDVDFESEDELGTATSLKQKLAKLRDELAAVKLERQQFLDGWQRAKADLVNERRDWSEAQTRASTSALDRAIESIVPVLDSFDMAMQGDAWTNVEPTWRTGVESIAKQLESALGELGARCFGAPGDAYDPALHEILQEVEADEPEHTVIRVARRGWKRGERVIRPAHVILSASKT